MRHYLRYDSMQAKDVLVGQSFIHDNRLLTRVLTNDLKRSRDGPKSGEVIACLYINSPAYWWVLSSSEVAV